MQTPDEKNLARLALHAIDATTIKPVFALYLNEAEDLGRRLTCPETHATLIMATTDILRRQVDYQSIKAPLWTIFYRKHFR